MSRLRYYCYSKCSTAVWTIYVALSCFFFIKNYAKVADFIVYILFLQLKNDYLKIGRLI